jgi:intracellular septation protein
MPANPSPAARPKASTSLTYALDFGPLLLFFLTAKFVGTMAGTAVFMVAILLAAIVSRIRLGHVSPMMKLSAALVIFFGALTLYFRDERFIQIKPTIIYVFFALMLLGGWLRGKALLEVLLNAVLPGLDRAGWLKLSRNWGLFFCALAIFNEITRQPAVMDFGLWLTVKTWVIFPLTMLFTMANVPMMLRHGLTLGEDEDAAAASKPDGTA